MGKKKKILPRIYVACLVVFLISVFISSVFLEEFSLDISKFPLQLVSLTFLPVKTVVSVNASLRENARLKKENQSLLLRLMQLQDAVSENRRLRELLSLKQQTLFSVVAARVLACDSSNFKRTLLVDKGKQDGIRVGSPALGDKGVVGVVVEAGSSASRIMLANDPDFSIAAKDERSRVIGVLSGSLEGTTMFKYLTLDDDVRVGDTIVSRGEHSRFLFDLPIGEVIAISKDSAGLSMFAVVKPYTKLSLLEEVLVIANE